MDFGRGQCRRGEEEVMDISTWIALGAITLINVVGWVYTKVYTYGKLEQKVKNLDDTINNGLVHKVDNLSNDVSTLEGTVSTFIKLSGIVDRRK